MVSFVALFQSTLPVWGATQRLLLTLPEELNFNPRSPCGERHLPTRPGLLYKYFNPRSPCGERQDQTSRKTPEKRFQSTLPVWGATIGIILVVLLPPISIHAPRVGSDVILMQSGFWTVFQSTLPVWGATVSEIIHAARRVPISIHAPRVGSDQDTLDAGAEHREFQSTLPVWGATPVFPDETVGNKISIHAPRVGSDGTFLPLSGSSVNFNPRSPCGERQGKRAGAASSIIISIHAPRVGSDSLSLPPPPVQAGFQSTLPVWGATYLPL